ncbi:putative ATP-dependent RNA helicase ddx60 [Phytophthora pseudosyringae]|uniref:Putative ATP-dependent RNA helicase ddx60 n=1 Tax=Phytophthora pseudosyringae TaxID=221518 RepID=A0A8T1WCQ0_9STRA|nr:putative ATP-dependent RNA helicase ddx60 [Phytophthora pseudosyringae]
MGNKAVLDFLSGIDGFGCGSSFRVGFTQTKYLAVRIGDGMEEAQSSPRKLNRSQPSRGDDAVLSKAKHGNFALPGRPFTTMGGAMLHLDSTTPAVPPTRESPHRRTLQPPATADAVLSRQLEATEGEFDVKKFLLNQKGTQPFHKSALFRASNFAKKVASMDLPSEEDDPSSNHLRSKKLVLPRMELGSSKSTGMLPGNSHKAHRTSGSGDRNQHSDEEDNPAFSHFYSIGKMAESCFHATQNKNKTWLFLPGSDERSKGSDGTSSIRGNSITGVERPSRRVDVLDLDRCFDTAIQFVTKKKHLDVACDDKLSMIDRDFMAIHARIAQRYNSAAGNDSSTDSHKVLTKLLFEQKWADVVVGELESMLTGSFLEQGVVLRKARILYAKAFFQLESLYRSQWQELMQEKDDLEQLREEMQRTNELHKQDAQGMKEFYEGEIQKLTTNFESVKGDMERRVTDSKEQMTKMGDTMKALNAIFRQMREDTEKVKAVELRENCIKLEQKYEQCREEVEQLRPLVHEKQQLLDKLEELNRERDACKEQIASLSNLLSTKDTMIASLMEQQSDLIAAQDLQAARDEELRRQAEEDKEDERDEDPYTAAEANAAGNGRRRPSISSTAVCVRCKQDLRVMSANGGLAEGDGEYGGRSNSPIEAEGFKLPVQKKRIQCLYFRILLPNLGGRRPQREIAWTFSCMRSIMFAKQIDDSMCKRAGGVFPLRIRMPEYVYAWFSPWRSMKEEKSTAEEGEFDAGADPEGITDPNSAASSEHRHMQADEDRWCLYYGVRSLVQQGYLEAKLFLSLLDEKFGEDEQVFMLHCYRVLDVLLGGRLNWGPLRDKVSYEMFAHEYDALFTRAPLPSHPNAAPATSVAYQVSGPRVPKTIWISPYHASLATSVILSKATETERAALDKKILEYVVTNVPEEERPAIYLEPKPSDEADDHAMHHKKRPKLDQHDKSKLGDDDVVGGGGGSQPAPQFVDANLWVELMMLEYKEEQAHRRAAIRLMFQTATTSAAASASESAANMSLSAMLGLNCASMDMEQFRVMVRTLNDEVPSFWVATLFRNAYTRGNGTVNFDSFMDAAETWQFFSTCMRLESPSSVVTRLLANPLSRTPAAISPSSKAAFVVEKFFAMVGNELRATIESLPIWTRNMTDSLAYDISSSLMEGSFSDGVRLLTSFQRLVDSLGVAKLVRRETTGSLLSSKDLFSIEKALHGLLDFARQRDKSTVELLIDAVRQKLCVRRVQMTFRKRLKRDNGAPLVLRSLMHRRYGSEHLDYSRRRAERPVIWFRLVVSRILRQSMQSVRMSALLIELSSISSAFHAGRSSPLQLSVSSSINGGIGPTPKPIFVELIYDYFLEKFGTRCEAERVIHDVFYNCRSLVRTDSLAMLFSYLCCMSNSCPEDRLLGQNEALAFLHAIFRCGLHNFRLIDPVPAAIPGKDGVSVPEGDAPQEDQDSAPHIASSVAGQTDFVAIGVAETILQTAFVKLSADQKMRMKLRLIEAASGGKSAAPSSQIEAAAFLVLAMREWRRYVLHRLNEIRVSCCAVEEELAQFEELLQLETLAAILQKAGVAYMSEDLCVIFRRLYITEKAAAPRGNSSEGSDASGTTATTDPMSDRIAAACFPLVAREALNELQVLEHAATKPFEVRPSPLQSYEFLVSTWGDYQEPCGELLQELRQVGKNNDIQAKALTRWPATNGADGPGPGTGGGNDVLYLSSSSSSSSSTVSSQDVAQQEAVHALFLDKLQRLTDLFDASAQQQKGAAPALRRSSISVKRDGSMLLVSEVNAQETTVNETWKVFRQMFVGFVKLRAVARLGKGALPDRWDG